MAELDEAKLVLADQHLQVCQQTGLIVCSKKDSCQIAFIGTRSMLRRHLKKYHQVDIKVFRKVFSAASLLTKGGVEAEKIKKYEEGGARHGRLQPVDGLPVLNGKQCVSCDRLFVHDETLRSHIAKEHPGSHMVSTCVAKLLVVPCQSLGRVSPRLKPYLIETSSVTRSVEQKLMYEPGAVVDDEDSDIEDCYKSSFVSVARVTERLSECNLDLEKVHMILGRSSPWNTPEFKKCMISVKQCLRNHLDEAKVLSKQCGQFYNFRSVIQTSGVEEKNRSFKFLESDIEGEQDKAEGLVPRDTLQRYVDHLSLVVRIACLVSIHSLELKGVFLSSDVENAAKNVAKQGMETDGECIDEWVFKLLWTIFSEEKKNGERMAAKELFAFTICACLCVHHDKKDQATFSNGRTVGSRLAGILYGASCYFALYILKHNAGDGWTRAIELVSKITSPESQHGLCFLTDLRSICCSLREEEAKVNPFQICTEHVMCGIYDGHEFRAEQYGNCVRRMHADAWEEMLALFNGWRLPEWFWPQAWDLAEDSDKNLLGYWALSDERNVQFVRRCASWAANAAVLNSLRVSGWKQWKDRAEEMFLLLLTAMHICGGGPARGTELGSMLLRTTKASRRNVYFPKDEVMLLPFYNKTRGLKRGRLILLTRHLDKETSGLLRAFFLLVYPLLVVQAQSLPETKQNKRYVASLRNRINLGKWTPKKMAEEVGRKMAQYEIPFNYSGFRQHQRGLVQMKEDFNLLRLVVEAAEEKSREAIRESTGSIGAQHQAAVMQGGHTMRTAKLFYAQTAASGEISLQAEHNRIEMFRKASQEWHLDLGLRQSTSNLLSKNLSKAETNENKADDSSSLHAFEAMLAMYPKLAEKLAKKTPAQLMSMLDNDVELRLASEPPSALEIAEETRQGVLSTPHVQEEEKYLSNNDTTCLADVAREQTILIAGVRDLESLSEPGNLISTTPPDRMGVMDVVPAASPDTVRSGNVRRSLCNDLGLPPELNYNDVKKTSAVPSTPVQNAKARESAENSGDDVLAYRCTARDGIGTDDSITQDRNGDGAGDSITGPFDKSNKVSVHSDRREFSGEARQQKQQQMSSNAVLANEEECKHDEEVARCNHDGKPGDQACKVDVVKRSSGSVVPGVVEDIDVTTVLVSGSSQCTPTWSQRPKDVPSVVISEAKKTEMSSLSYRYWNRFRLRGTTKKQGKYSERHSLNLEGSRTQEKNRDVTQSAPKCNSAPLCRPDIVASPSSIDPKISTKIRTAGVSKLVAENPRSKRASSLDMATSSDLSGGHRSKISRKHDVSLGAQLTPLFPSKVIGSAFDSLAALRQVTFPNAQFKTEAQKRAMEAVALRRSDLLIVLATGEGKTAVVMGPVCKEVGVTVWVCPLRALRWETERRLKSGGLEVFSLGKLPVNRARQGVGMVLLVSPEDVAKPDFVLSMKQMEQRNALNRVVIDEAHLTAMAESYRPCFTLLKSATMFGTLCPIVMLTATAPPRMTTRIAGMCGSNSGGLEVHRGDPCRPNLSLRVQYLQDDDDERLMNEVTSAVEAMTVKYKQSAARCLVVCLTIAHAMNIHSRMLSRRILNEKDVLLYHSQRQEKVRERVMMSWQGPLIRGVRVVVATEGFSTGTDAANVRLVLFAGGSRNLVDFWQGAGRAGRDGGPGDVLVLFHENHLRNGRGGRDEEEITEVEMEAGDFGAWARNQTRCRRALVEQSLTGSGEGQTCGARLQSGMNVFLCDICVVRSKTTGLSTASKHTDNASGKEVAAFVPGVKRPSAMEISTARVEQRKRTEFSEGERAWLRSVAVSLRGLCLEHVLQLYGKEKVVADSNGIFAIVFAEARLCAGRCESRIWRCHRCQSTGHNAKHCSVFHSIRIDPMTGLSTGNGHCRECRLLSVHGQNPHRELEFGKPNCPLKSCLYLMMRAWDKEHIRRDMVHADTGLHCGLRGLLQERPQFGLWLTEETANKQAGITRALRWLMQNLPGGSSVPGTKFT